MTFNALLHLLIRHDVKPPCIDCTRNPTGVLAILANGLSQIDRPGFWFFHRQNGMLRPTRLITEHGPTTSSRRWFLGVAVVAVGPLECPVGTVLTGAAVAAFVTDHGAAHTELSKVQGKDTNEMSIACISPLVHHGQH